MQTPTSWVLAANHPESEFPLANLPYGVCRIGTCTQVCVAIGSDVLGLQDAVSCGALDSLPLKLREACSANSLQPLLRLREEDWRQLRQELTRLLRADADPTMQSRLRTCLHPQDTITMQMPFAVRDYTDFYASSYHAERVGRIFRPEQPLLPNYKHVPIGYHGRASSIVLSGTPVRRPWGQSLNAATQQPIFAPSRALDFELEVGIVIGDENPLGEPVPIASAHRRIFGLCLLNDWSARDIQSWEYRPLGPFLAKSFATTISPWIVPFAALTHARVPLTARSDTDPQLLAYLKQSRSTLPSITLTAHLQTARMRAEKIPAVRITQTNLQHLFWSLEQLVTHHASNGCNLRAGDLLATGTLSGPERGSEGCLLEMSANSAARMLPNGEQRVYLEDSDEIILTGITHQLHQPCIGFGTSRGMILPAQQAYGVAAGSAVDTTVS